MKKEELLSLLWEREGEYRSGAELAGRLGVSRAAVWKAVEQLRAQGCRIDSVPRRGYRISGGGDLLCETGIRRYLTCQGLSLQVFPSIGSTNTALKELAAAGAPEGTVLVAGEQSAGRGRRGRSFYSPPGSGVYLSLLLRPELPAEEVSCLTACAAVAVAETIEDLSGRPAGIKWVNDVLVDGKKVCGILSEAALDCESGSMSYVIVGLGVNVLAPEGGFPEDLRDLAGAVFADRGVPDPRCRLAAGILDRLTNYYRQLPERSFFDAYRRRSLVLGSPILILSPGKEPRQAEALDLEPDFGLRVRLEDGKEEVLRSGEISIRPLPAGAERRDPA